MWKTEMSKNKKKFNPVPWVFHDPAAVIQGATGAETVSNNKPDLCASVAHNVMIWGIQ